MIATKTITHRFHAYGQMGLLFQLVEDVIEGRKPRGVYEILLEGPSGTGKSRAALEVIRTICRARMFKNVRVLLARKTLKSMRDTVLVEWETAVLTPDDLPRPRRHAQTPHYSWDKTGAEVVCCGFDDPNKILSGQFDIAFINEAKEISITDYETVLTRMRNGKIGWHLVIVDTNPDAPGHWLNERASVSNTGLDGMLRIRNKLDDNPRWVDQKTGEYTDEGEAYVGILDRLSGVRYRRYRLGEWCMAEGAIWPNFDPDKHVISGTMNRAEGYWWLDTSDLPGEPTIMIKWFFASVDFGFRGPGCMLVWGVDDKNRIFVVSETYYSGKNKNWWADEAEKQRKKWDIQKFICDSADPDAIDIFNERMGRAGGHWAAIPCKKQKLGFEPSASCVRERFDSETLFFLRDISEHTDLDLVADHKFLCTVDEIPSYEYKEAKDGQKVRDEPKDNSVDHGCDALRYGMWWFDGPHPHDWRPDEPESKYPVGSYAQLMGHEAITERWR